MQTLCSRITLLCSYHDKILLTSIITKSISIATMTGIASGYTCSLLSTKSFISIIHLTRQKYGPLKMSHLTFTKRKRSMVKKTTRPPLQIIKNVSALKNLFTYQRSRSYFRMNWVYSRRNALRNSSNLSLKIITLDNMS